MGLLIFIVVAVVALAVLVFRRGSDEDVARDKRALWVRRIALILMGLSAAFWAFMGVGEMASGDFSGVIHLVPAAMIVLLMFLARQRPLEGGIVLAILGVAASAYFYNAGAELARNMGIIAITGAPFLVCGLLFLAAAALARRGR